MTLLKNLASKEAENLTSKSTKASLLLSEQGKECSRLVKQLD